MQIQDAIERQIERHSEALFDAHLFDIGNTPVTLLTIVVVAAILVVTALFSWLMRRAVTGVLRRSNVADEGTIKVVSRLTHYLLLLIGVGIGLNTAGIDLSALFAAGALFAVAAGFAMQDLGANLAAGLTLLIERAIKPGDVLEVDGKMVTVQRMGLRATVARTLDDENIIIPNSVLVKEKVINDTFRDSLKRIRVTVGVSYSSDMRGVRRVLQEAASGVEWRSTEREPVVLLTEFGDSSVVWEVSVWIDDPWRSRSLRSLLREAIWFAFVDAGITISFPQVDLHLDPPVMKALEGLARAS